MNDLRITLYEIFGYLLPGGVFCASIGLIFWAIYFPQAVVEFDLQTVEVWATCLAFAYIGGHVVQAVGNKVTKQFTSAENRVMTDPAAFPTKLIKACREKADRMLKAECHIVDKTDLEPLWLYRFCDDAVLRSGKLGEREVYVYREGFCRGAFIGFVLLAMALIAFSVRLWLFADNQRARVGTVELTPGRMLFFSVLAAISSHFLWNRFWRFGEYRVTQALLGFLTINDKPEEKAKETKPNSSM